MQRLEFNKVWIDGKEIHAAATLRATGDIKHDSRGTPYPVHLGSKCTMLIVNEYAREIFQKVAELQRFDVAVLRGAMVTVAENLLAVEQITDEGALVRIEMKYGKPLRIVTEKEWVEGLR